MAKELGCPCGGATEARGSLRLYEEGDAVEKADGHREWIAGEWRAPIETATMDDVAGRQLFYCRECDRELHLDDMRVLTPDDCGYKTRVPI